MKLVSEQSDHDLATKRAEENVGHHLRQVAANLMRCARGAGKPWEIERQIDALAEAFDRYRGINGYAVSTHAMHEHLDVGRGTNSTWSDGPASPGYDVHHRMQQEADEVILRGALQVVASRMVAQPLQESRGKGQILEGLSMREEAIAERKRPKDDGPTIEW